MILLEPSLIVDGRIHQDFDGLLEGALHPRAHVRAVNAVASDGHQVAAVAHDLTRCDVASKCNIVEACAIVKRIWSNLAAGGLARGGYQPVILGYSDDNS